MTDADPQIRLLNRVLTPASTPCWWLPYWWLWTGLAFLPINVAPTLLLLLWGIGAWIRRSWRGILAKWDQVEQCSALVLLLIGVATVASPFWDLSLPGSFNQWPFVGVLLACRRLLGSGKMRRQVVQILGAGGILVSLLGLGQAAWGWHYRLGWDPMVLTLLQTDRPTSIFASPNTLAIYLVMMQALMLGLWVARPDHSDSDDPAKPDLDLDPERLRGRSLDRGLAIALLITSVPLLGLTASRNGWGIAWVGGVIALVWFNRWRILAGWLGLTALPVGAALNLLGLRRILPVALWGRLADSLDPQATYFSSTANRVDGWQFALEMMRQRPWTGWGWQSFQRLYNAQIPAPPEFLTHPHNLYLMLGSEGGILVLASLLGLWGILLYRGWRQARTDPLSLGAALALTCYFASGGLDVVMLDARINVMVWVLLSWCGSTPPPDPLPSALERSAGPPETPVQT
jgi:O-antigen ligase